MPRIKSVQAFHPVNNMKPLGLICYRADPCKTLITYCFLKSFHFSFLAKLESLFSLKN